MVKPVEVKTLAPMVEKLLREHPETKDSYEALFALAIIEQYKLYRKDFLTEEVEMFLHDLGDNPMFRIETLTRARRLVTKKNPELESERQKQRRKDAEHPDRRSEWRNLGRL
jgi:hypothetical protein